ncbi:putative amino acid transporter [Mollisia scopiformis]|uniref:Putative amino acid transporter n=1 Tax=Mollisia scopiformis TaxID=149040 RepID=A0A132B7B9_MOLSC|nr:putative amino acid transporter [Mollisia scopiformis]KUJ08241.1 putative amino acid transporter [Mollisia scopiformis]
MSLAALALDGGDPRLHVEGEPEKGLETPEKDGHDLVEGNRTAALVRPVTRPLYDNTISFEEFVYYAEKTRAEEEAHVADIKGTQGWLEMIFPSKSGMGAGNVTADEKHGAKLAHDMTLADPRARLQISDDEWTNASRALRTATKSAIFYLITTDILGPFGLPYAFAGMGWGPGVALFTVFAGLAIYSGYLLWTIFMGMDSYEYPIKSYGDMGQRLYGPWLRFIFNVLQALQLVFNVGLIVVSNGEALSQAAKFKLCFAVCCLVWCLAGFILGQVRTLQKFGWLANAAVWLNVICMIITMGAAAHTAPNYLGASQSIGAALNNGTSVTAVNGVYPAVQHSNGLPPSPTFAGSVNAAMQAVFSYGGAMIFPEFMSEMRYPRDFLKGMWAAQSFIYLVYMFYGLFMYGYQGQYVINPSFLGIGPYNFQTAGNVFAMISSAIAAALYGNIGIKVIYNNIFVEWFHAPGLTTKAGKIIWTGMIPVYWSIAFAIGAGIPAFAGLSGIVSAICILQFTFTFPPFLSIAYNMKRNAMLPEEGFDPATGPYARKDKGPKRWIRGFFGKFWWMNIFNFFYTGGALTLAALGAYAGIEIVKQAFASGASNSFVCKSPLQ